MTKTCGCLGCREDPTHVIERDGKRRVVCTDHADGGRVIEYL